MPEIILGVSFKYPDGCIVSLPKPFRHEDIVWILASAKNHPSKYNQTDFYEIHPGGSEVQGFYTNQRPFVDRYEGAAIAKDSGQLLTGRLQFQSTTLFSEDLW